MRSVTATEANRDFSKLLREVAAGETVVVTSHGRAVAKLAPVDPADVGPSGEERQRREKAWQDLQARLRSQPVLNLGPFKRDELYDEDS